MTPHQFIAKWKPADLKERAACQIPSQLRRQDYEGEPFKREA